MPRWTVRKVAGKKTLQVYDERIKRVVAESQSGATTAITTLVVSLRLVAGDLDPTEVLNLDETY